MYHKHNTYIGIKISKAEYKIGELSDTKELLILRYREIRTPTS